MSLLKSIGTSLGIKRNFGEIHDDLYSIYTQLVQQRPVGYMNDELEAVRVKLDGLRATRTNAANVRKLNVLQKVYEALVLLNNQNYQGVATLQASIAATPGAYQKKVTNSETEDKAKMLLGAVMSTLNDRIQTKSLMTTLGFQAIANQIPKPPTDLELLEERLRKVQYPYSNPKKGGRKGTKKSYRKSKKQSKTRKSISKRH